jgi:protein-tyrosine-phosphatase/ubiquinone/menaquinone biosynthesis C-methylase UbiE
MRVLFVCVGNAGRSQMAHAFLERAGGDARSAGTWPSPGVHPNVAEAMNEVGIDLSGRVPRRLDPGDLEWAELVVRMGCGDDCPVVKGKRYLDWPVDDPIDRTVAETRPIRDEIERRVAGLVTELRIERSGYLRDGFAHRYDAFRPRPPGTLLELLVRYAGSGRPRLVVDLGSGTGLSTEVWAGRAQDVVGIEPNPLMRAVAESRAPAGVRYLDGHSAETGLTDGSADVVTVSQAFHWMEAEPTLAEVARILRPGGVFAVYDYEWPPTIHPDVDVAFDEVVRRVQPWGPRGKDHLEPMRSSGRFRYVKEIGLHSEEPGDAERAASTAWTMGPVAKRLADGEETEESIGLTRLRAVAEQALGDGAVPFLFTYRVRLAVR